MTTESPANAAPARSAPYYRGVALVLGAGVFLSIGGIGGIGVLGAIVGHAASGLRRWRPPIGAV